MKTNSPDLIETRAINYLRSHCISVEIAIDPSGNCTNMSKKVKE